MKHNPEFEKSALEIYMLYRDRSGAFSAVSGNLGRNDSSKLSRQLNPTDERRDNPFIEVMEILAGTMSFSPELEEKVWQILERERGTHRKDAPTFRAQIADMLNKIFSELGDVSTINLKGGSKADWEKESFELLKAAENLYEKVKQWRDE
jgi:hypothetical protein